MLDAHLIAKVRPLANSENVILWKNYRITVLQPALFRIEQSENKIFRDEATQTVWFRDMPKQDFTAYKEDDYLKITTSVCSLIIGKKREDCRIILNGQAIAIDNAGNLLGTYRTLDEFDGDTHVNKSTGMRKKGTPQSAKIQLGTGVCSMTGVAVFNDENSLTLTNQGEIIASRGDGSDEYVFAYGSDYRSAVKALYMITGKVPKIPRFALGNWWSRYYVYTDKSYLRLLNSFEENDIPLSVATIDMDWHYSKNMEGDLHISQKGRNTPFYGGNDGWTGYTWNKNLFPDYRAFLKEIEKKNLKITLNLHPALGIRWWEDCYEEMAKSLGQNPETGEWVKFDISSDRFINAYFSVIHKPYERDGVRFWWIDWQQGVNSKIEGLDPLWSLNHYHYLDNAKNYGLPLILSRYSGIGAHRYPLGFSGDTVISWDTLQYLPEFTATATNVGYTWWSHDIGGHMFGEKNNELYLRHIQYGVFSPINRLHCTLTEICTKEPWAYGNGAGEIAKNWLRLRHALVPYIYTASFLTNSEGRALVEPLYNQWKNPEAYEYKQEYLFGSQLLVAPVTTPADKNGYATVSAWIPEGKWTDIFTGQVYKAKKGGKKVKLYRELESIPVLIKEGGILPLSLEKGNGCPNPEKMKIEVYSGNGEYTLYEDALEQNRDGELFTKFKNVKSKSGEFAIQKLIIKAEGDYTVSPKKRLFKIRFKDIKDGEVSFKINGVNQPIDQLLTDCAGIDITIEGGNKYEVSVKYLPQSEVSALLSSALKVLITAQGETEDKTVFWNELCKVTTKKQYLKVVKATKLISKITKSRLKEIT